jgi:hypothetical protein
MQFVAKSAAKLLFKTAKICKSIQKNSNKFDFFAKILAYFNYL